MSLSPYYIRHLIVVCEIISAVHIVPYNFYFFSCPNHSILYLCIFGYILVLAALTVSGWSALSFLVVVTFLSPRSTLFPVTPGFSLNLYFLDYCYCSSLPLPSHKYMVQCGRALLATLKLCEIGSLSH